MSCWKNFRYLLRKNIFLISLNSQIILSENQKGYYGTTLFPLSYLNLTGRSFGAYIQKIMFRSINRCSFGAKWRSNTKPQRLCFRWFEKIFGLSFASLVFCMVQKRKFTFTGRKSSSPEGDFWL